MHDLMRDRLVAVDLRSTGHALLSLPGLYERLMANDVVGFRGLRAHQEHAAHAFLCQTAAIAIHKSALVAPPDSESDWRRILTAATHPHITAWELIVTDPALPAFMQPPVPGCRYKNRKLVPCPDDLDSATETSKNHDHKQSVAWRAEVSAWMWPLVALQTGSGFTGRGNYGVARMAGSYGSRSAFAFVPIGMGIGDRVRRDITAMLRHRRSLCDEHGFLTDRGGLDFLWLESWSGEKSETFPLSTARLDPYFVEVCRLVRLRNGDSGCVAESMATKGPRIDSKAAFGAVGDFWTPIAEGTGKALTMRERTLRYDMLTSILFDRKAWRLPLAMESDDASRFRLHASGVAKGGAYGKSVGFKRRGDVIVPLEGVRNPDIYGNTSKAMLGCVEAVGRALNLGLETYGKVRLESNEINYRDRAKAGTARHRRVVEYGDRFQSFVDGVYFDQLVACVNTGELAMTRFRTRIASRAESILESFFEATPMNARLQICAEVRAMGAFRSSLSKWWPDWRDHVCGIKDQKETVDAQ